MSSAEPPAADSAEPVDSELGVMQGIVERLARDLAQSRVTVAELDVRLQLATAKTARVEAERDQLRATTGQP